MNGIQPDPRTSRAADAERPAKAPTHAIHLRTNSLQSNFRPQGRRLDAIGRYRWGREPVCGHREPAFSSVYYTRCVGFAKFAIRNTRLSAGEPSVFRCVSHSAGGFDSGSRVHSRARVSQRAPFASFDDGSVDSQQRMDNVLDDRI